jgi:hypothetical protein
MSAHSAHVPHEHRTCICINGTKASNASRLNRIATLKLLATLANVPKGNPC